MALGKRLEEVFGTSLPEELGDALARLARHYIPTRYPAALRGGLIREHYRRADAGQARADAIAIVDFTATLWSESGLWSETDEPDGDGPEVSGR